MRFLRFICWLKGFHESWYQVVSHSYDMSVYPAKTTTSGLSSPCIWCGKQCPADSKANQLSIAWGDGK